MCKIDFLTELHLPRWFGQLKWSHNSSITAFKNNVFLQLVRCNNVFFCPRANNFFSSTALKNCHIIAPNPGLCHFMFARWRLAEAKFHTCFHPGSSWASNIRKCLEHHNFASGGPLSVIFSPFESAWSVDRKYIPSFKLLCFSKITAN